MKPGLKRIESTLNQLRGQTTTLHRQAPGSVSVSTQSVPASRPIELPSPTLPKFKFTNTTEASHIVGSTLVISLLKEMQGTVIHWQTELHRTLLQIQEIYLEGPVVNGWLESSIHKSDRPDETAPPTTQESRPDYRLCGVTADGKPWSRACAPEEVPYLSLAIVRYHRLSQLLTQKQGLESRLSCLAQNLIKVHGEMGSQVCMDQKNS